MISMPVLRKLAVICLAVLVAALVLFITTAVVFAQPPKMSAIEAHSATLNGDLIILDIRSPGEWAETGVAKGAWPVTMHSPNFGPNLQSIIERYPNRSLALICATGGRSDHVATVLEQNGLSGVIDISEGMSGNGIAPGWISRNLPIVDVTVARGKHTASMLKKD
ncbi:rhodanese-like domain-containing protein [Sulfitobacter sp. SK012]|uniref:rhodanese-like domain-containing protein n=1 Tax=Sulfitobacter sp. SK012 TaxID=1389005 RepID=UPI0020C7FFDE|nr:rhodanese-like domain-containing protein [Sulfitobacter sp. SK012]